MAETQIHLTERLDFEALLIFQNCNVSKSALLVFRKIKNFHYVVLCHT